MYNHLSGLFILGRVCWTWKRARARAKKRLNNDRRQQQQCRFSSEFSHSLWKKKYGGWGEGLMDILLLWGRFLRPSARVSLFPPFFSWVLFSLLVANNQLQRKKRKQSLSIFVILARLRTTDFN